MESFGTLVNSYKSLSIVPKLSILDMYKEYRLWLCTRNDIVKKLSEVNFTVITEVSTL